MSSDVYYYVILIGALHHSYLQTFSESRHMKETKLFLLGSRSVQEDNFWLVLGK